jgi:hypothetical protein
LALPAAFPDAATAALRDGLDSGALRLLAGTDGADGPEARRLLDRALAELGVPAPSPSGAVALLAREACAAIVAGDLAPHEGAERIWDLTLRAPDERLPELDPFVYAASEWRERPADRADFDAGVLDAAREILARG